MMRRPETPFWAARLEARYLSALICESRACEVCEPAALLTLCEEVAFSSMALVIRSDSLIEKAHARGAAPARALEDAVASTIVIKPLLRGYVNGKWDSMLLLARVLLLPFFRPLNQ